MYPYETPRFVQEVMGRWWLNLTPMSREQKETSHQRGTQQLERRRSTILRPGLNEIGNR